ncbi:ATP-binding protein [Streptantibioticus parmotrematis]|uniref:ATP-binding protein n=1 Tax=Streptantibioticus parmotrematis TaxID=2873249 RepID=UPI0034071703
MNAEVPPIDAPVQLSASHCRLSLDAVPHALAVVRRIVRAQLRAWEVEDLARPAAMGVTELLSNVHKHAKSPECVLTLRRITGGIRVSVSDKEPELPVVREPDFLSESGRGMFLLSKTAHAWGAIPAPEGAPGKEVWFVLKSEVDG